MALKSVLLPECDVCHEIWLPDKRLPDGSINPARSNPELCKRCGKCKSPRWNEKARTAKREKEKQEALEGASAGHRRKVEDAQVESTGKSANDAGDAVPAKRIPNGAGLEKLIGVFAKEFAELGGGEAFLKAERNWGPDAWERYEMEEKQRRERSA